MNQLKKHAAQAMLVVMVVSSCPTAQAISLDDCSEYVGKKAQQFVNQIKKHKVAVFLFVVAAVGVYAYQRKPQEDVVTEILDRHYGKGNLDISIIKEDRGWLYQLLFAPPLRVDIVPQPAQ